MLLFFYATIPLSPAKKNAGAAEQFFHGGGEAAADGGDGAGGPASPAIPSCGPAGRFPASLARPSPSKCEGSVPNVAAMMGKCKSSVPYIDGARGI